MKIHDIILSDHFWSDWKHVPDGIKKRFNQDLEIISEIGKLPNGIQAHKIKNYCEDGWWVGYISTGKFAWRFLFSVTASGVMVVERIISHNEMDQLLK